MSKIDIPKEKIDLVYAWVDSSDDNWQKKKAEFELANGLAPDKLVSRYRNNDELKYSLRSVEKNASWINHIYIITDNQIPDWLNTNHPKITIVDHKEIIPAEALPTYNSNAILHSMVNIPNLSDYFLYSDDDMYFYDYVAPSFFYKNDGYPVCRFIKEPKNPTKAYKTWIENSQKLIKDKFNKKYTVYPHHCVDAYKKSDIEECRKKFKGEIDKIVYHHFRNNSDSERVLYMYYACVKEHGHYKRISKIDSDLSFFEKIKNFITKTYRKDSLKFYSISKNIENDLAKYRPKLICINDTFRAKENDIQNARQILEKLFPNKSDFEK